MSADNPTAQINPQATVSEQPAKGDGVTTSKSEGEVSVDKGQVIMDAYVKLTIAQWEWPKFVGPWLRNALGPFLHTDALTRNDGHPLCGPDDASVLLYDVTDKAGNTRLSFSLRQLEYIQYYIHETRMADPVWVKHITSLGDLDKSHPSDAEVGPPEYPEGEEWLPLPDAFIHGEAVVAVEEIRFTDPKEIKRYLNTQRRKNKQIKMKRWQMGEPEFDEARAKAMADNARPGPGLRRGPEKQRELKSRQEQEEDDASKPNPTNPLDARPNETAVERAKTLKALENLQIEPERGLSPAMSNDSSDFSPPPEAQGNFTTAYYNHARQALQLASVGGMFEAYKSLPEYASLMPSSGADQPPIGRSLFICIRVVTWEMDEETVLEVGWSAVWFQEQLGEVSEDEERFEECRERGHIIVQDHLLEKRNGNLKPEYRSDYLCGSSIALAAKDVKSFIETKLKDLSKRAGGGPTYIILHSNDEGHANLAKLGIKTDDWYRQFRPSAWENPCYTSVDGIGKTFIIDTAMLFAAVESDPKAIPAPIKTSLSLEDLAWSMFPQDQLRSPVLYGNAGNDAFYNMEVFLALLMAPSLETLQEEYRKTQADLGGTSEVDAPASQVGTPDMQIPRTPSESVQSDHEAPHNADGQGGDDEEFSSDEDMPDIKGVFVEGPDGELIEVFAE